MKCKFKEWSEYQYIIAAGDGKKKLGKYHRSWFGKQGYGHTCWAIIAGLEVDGLDKLLEDKSVHEVAQECLEILNSPPPKKRKTKRLPKKPYGNLEIHKAHIKMRDDAEYIQIIFFTDQQKNKYFWGQGPQGMRTRRNRKGNT